MDGLECSEINISELERTLRIDAEFYQKSNLNIMSFLEKKEIQPFTQSFLISDGNHMSISESFCEIGIPYYRGQDIYNVFIEESSPICIDEKTFQHPHMMRSHLKRGDVLMSIVGAIIGNSAIVSENRDSTCSCKLAIMRSRMTEIFPEVLLVFIKTKYGQNQIQKFKRGTAQTGLLLEDFNQLFIPKFTEAFQENICQIVREAHKSTLLSKKIYDEAQDILQEELGLKAKEIPKENMSEQKFSESFSVSGRLDAEYYQPKYDYILSQIYNYDSNAKKLSDIANYISTGEYSDSYYLAESVPDLSYYIRGTDIDSGFVKQDASHCVISSDFKKFVVENDIITGRVGTIGKFGMIDASLAGSVYSDNILCFHLPENYLPDVYALYFNNSIIQELIKRLSRGSVQQRLNQETLREIIVPNICLDVQSGISVKIQKSFKMRMKAEKLIQIANKSMELAIEKDEKVAIDWLSTNNELWE